MKQSKNTAVRQHMILFPAVDILDGQCVRLLYGDREKKTVYGDPLHYALKWQAAGASYLHLVDLNGAFDYTSVNSGVLKEIAASVKIKTQAGGGIRTLHDVESRLNLGITRVILGTAAYENIGFVRDCVKRFPGRVICGIDCKDGFAAVRGWTQKTAETGADLALRLKDAGIDTVVYTDISRDGALTGVNADACKKLQDATGMKVIASGGVSGCGDIARLAAEGVHGAILGRALYTGDLSIETALNHCALQEER